MVDYGGLVVLFLTYFYDMTGFDEWEKIIVKETNDYIDYRTKQSIKAWLLITFRQYKEKSVTD